MKLPEVEEKTKLSITQAFLRSIAQLHVDSLRPLKELYLEFLEKYPANFEQFCIESKGRSNWKYLLRIQPQLLPGYIKKTSEEENETETGLYEEQLGEILGEVARILAGEAYWLEDTADNLLKIGLVGRCR